MVKISETSTLSNYSMLKNPFKFLNYKNHLETKWISFLKLIFSAVLIQQHIPNNNNNENNKKNNVK